jgi:hypothetical protein
LAWNANSPCCASSTSSLHRLQYTRYTSSMGCVSRTSPRLLSRGKADVMRPKLLRSVWLCPYGWSRA